jgi:hypothetical protein
MVHQQGPQSRHTWPWGRILTCSKHEEVGFIPFQTLSNLDAFRPLDSMIYFWMKQQIISRLEILWQCQNVLGKWTRWWLQWIWLFSFLVWRHGEIGTVLSCRDFRIWWDILNVRTVRTVRKSFHSSDVLYHKTHFYVIHFLSFTSTDVEETGRG